MHNRFLSICRLNGLLKCGASLPFFAAIILLAGALPSCIGKRKPPLPPIERVVQRVEIKGIQQGGAIILTWKMPARNADDDSLLNVDRIDVYRLIEPLTSPISLSEEEFSSKSTLIANIPVTDADFALAEKTYTDNLEFSDQPVRLRYAIRFVNKSGQKAVFSNFLLIEPVAAIAERPTDLTGEVTQDEIILTWKKPAANVDGTAAGSVLGYNVYRYTEDRSSARQLNTTPVKDNRFADANFQFEENYGYFVRTVSLGSNGEPIESFDSNVFEVKPVDKFPPQPPEAITVAAAPNVISIFFAVNLEKDIAAYRIYRSENSDAPKNEWELLTEDSLKVNTFADSQVEAGKTYYYYIVAVDRFGNASQPSEVVSETAL